MIQFSDEQKMLLETASEFCRNESPIAKVRASLDAGTIDTAIWQQITDLGWLGINIPETYGGLGLGLGSVVPVVESMGRNLLATPYTSTVLAAECLALCGSEAQKNDVLPKIAAGSIASLAFTEEDGSWLLDKVDASGTVTTNKVKLQGTKAFVCDGDVAEFIIANVQIDGAARLVLINNDQILAGSLTREVVIDQTRRSFQLNLDGIEINTDQVLPNFHSQQIELANSLLLSADACGGLASCLGLIIEYLNTRKAFNKFIGSYQGLKHPSADILISLESLKSHVYHGATQYDEDIESAEIAVRMAKAVASGAYAYAGDRAVQFHGGFGFTFECDAQLYLRLALWCQYQGGDQLYQRRLLASLLLDEIA